VFWFLKRAKLIEFRILHKAMDAKKIFLIDSIGAVISACMLGLALVHFQQYIGMPAKVLYSLAAIASVFAVYSFLGYLGKLWPHTIALKVISLGNLAYCSLTVFLMINHYESLTVLGITYFVTEKLIVVPLAILEWKTSKS
jgi:hypothetical protein